MRQAMVFQLSTAGLEVVSYSSAEGFLGAPCANEFDCIVTDLFLPRMNGLQLQEKLHRVAPFASIVFVTGHGDLSLGMQAMKKGAVDFLEKPVDDQALLNSINRGVELSRSRRSDHVQMAELKARHESLTSREREVFSRITKGLLNKQVAAELGTTERTIKAHRERVMSKMAAAPALGPCSSTHALRSSISGGRSLA